LRPAPFNGWLPRLRAGKRWFPRRPSLSVHRMKVKALEAFSGPGSRALPAEIMRHHPLPGRVGQTGLGSMRRFAVRVGATGGRPMGPPHPAEAGLSLLEKGSPDRCFLRAMPLTPGHDKGYLQNEWIAEFSGRAYDRGEGGGGRPSPQSGISGVPTR
jgi:hypothetical protein